MITNPIQIAVSIIAVAFLGISSLKIGIIDMTGLIAAEFVGCSILLFGGVEWFIILLSFFIITGLFTKYKYEQKRNLDVAEEKGGARGWQNVLANGIIASLSAIGYGYSSSNIFITSFLGAISTSTADTLATEIGVLYHHKPRLITNLRKSVKSGTSGGISILGEMATLFGSSWIGLTVWGTSLGDLTFSKALILVVIAGFLGCTFDSLLGATVQAVFRCTVCGRETDKIVHCGQASSCVKGNKVLDNNMINLVSTIFGAFVAILVSLII